MYLCVRLFLQVDRSLEKLLLAYETAYKNEVKRICDIFIQKDCSYEYPYRLFSRSISYNSKHLVLVDAKEMFQKYKKGEPFRYDYTSYWSNSSYSVTDEYLKIELGLDLHRDRLLIPIYKNKQPLHRLFTGKPMNMKLIKRKQYWYADIYVQYQPVKTSKKETMGIDLGMKVPAVAATSTGKIRFFGNGRELRFIQRKYKAHIKAMQKHKQYEKLMHFQHKLSHILKNYDHNIANEIIAFAVAQNVGTIKLEQLTSINKKFNVQHNPDIYLWSYRRLQDYIAYKAELQSISVIYINPYHTSQLCPACGKVNKPVDRSYICSCGYKNHRDAIAAINILNAL